MPLSQQHSLLAELEAIHSAMEQPIAPDLLTLLDKAREHEKWPVARLISIFERHNTDALIKRHQIIRHIETHPERFGNEGYVFGFTGTPGAGKSSLIGALCLKLIEQNPELSIAIVAIDPSSQESGGALLGDRTRTIFPSNDKRIFFRSQASHLDLGGMGKTTFHAVRLLKKLFDIVIIETVGIGQSEVEVQHIADHTVLIMQPLAGDQVQFMKAGIMEVPDTFVINKCDEDELARKSRHLLKASLKLAKIYVHQDQEFSDQEIFMTSAIKDRGIAELGQKLVEQCAKGNELDNQKRDAYFLNKWLQSAYGEFGERVIEHLGADSTLSINATFEEKELSYQSRMASFLSEINKD